ncbi:hypothetical protein AB0B66_10975 [Catellatospora sp. NPDC049111]|uniref:hypothetical protein n=1 Tax=Catellatospora sp. NPDC049111 TaxID=3155271 RepID=UPI0033E8626F
MSVRSVTAAGPGASGQAGERLRQSTPVEQSILELRDELLDRAFQSPSVTSVLPTSAEQEGVRRLVAARLPGRLRDIMQVTRVARARFDKAKEDAAAVIPSREPALRRALSLVRNAMIMCGAAAVLVALNVTLQATGALSGNTDFGALAAVLGVLTLFALITTPGRSRHLLLRGGDKKPVRFTGPLLAIVGGAVLAALVSDYVVDDISSGLWDPALILVGGIPLAFLRAQLAAAVARAARSSWTSDLDADWPTPTSTFGLQLYERARRARRDWINALVHQGIPILVGDELDKRAPSYVTWLGEQQPTRILVEITETAQLVATRASRQLSRTLANMTTASVGISGPRGVGKSALLSSMGDVRLRRTPSALSLVISAPTGYDSREFLIELFTQVCRFVAGDPVSPPSRAGWDLGRRWPALLAGIGLVTAVGAAIWPLPEVLTHSALAHPRWTVGIAGALAMVIGIALHVRAGGQPVSEEPIVVEARRHLETLGSLQTHTIEHSATVKAPAWIEAAKKKSVQRAETPRTYPQLVRAFRDFVERLGRDARGGPGRSGPMTICIDELDKIGSAEEAERFLNDIKAIFGVSNCHYLVSLSEDAIASFERRALTLRTAFDSAFDAVIVMPRLNLDEVRHLLARRLIVLPEPFIALCHSLSAGLPRDVIRTVRAMLDVHASALDELIRERAQRERQARRAGGGRVDRTRRETLRVPLARIAAELVQSDLQSVTEGQLASLGRLRGVEHDAALSWVGSVTSTALDGPALIEHCGRSPDIGTVTGPASAVGQDPGMIELVRLVRQYRAYLYYAATVLDAFCAGSDRVAEVLQDEENPIELLAQARAHLAIDHTRSWRLVDEFRKRWGLPVEPPPAWG